MKLCCCNEACKSYYFMSNKLQWFATKGLIDFKNSVIREKERESGRERESV